MLRLLALATVVSLAAACSPPEPAPEELDALIHYFFTDYETEEEATLADAIANTLEWWRANTAEGESEGSVTDLRVNEVTPLGMPEDLSMQFLVGVYHLVLQTCSLEEIERIYLEPDQMSLFPGNYDNYTREFQDGEACYSDGSCDRVTWTTEIEDSLMGKSMTYGMSSGLRRFTGIDLENEERSAVLSLTWMLEPAVIGEGGGAAFFDQAYQIEVFVPVDDRALHLYGIWNSGGLDGVDPDAPIWANSYLDGVKDWDIRLDEICDEGLVP